MTNSVAGGRNSGRTLRMVQGLTKGDAVIVHSVRMRDYLRRMMADLRGADFLLQTRIFVISREEDAYRLRGCSQPRMHVDHACYDYWSAETEAVVAKIPAVERGRLKISNEVKAYHNGVEVPGMRVTNVTIPSLRPRRPDSPSKV